MSIYTYSIANDTQFGVLNGGLLDLEIRKSETQSLALRSISTIGDVLNIEFSASISAQEKTDLDAVVSAHNGFLRGDVEKFTLVDTEGNPIGTVDDNGNRRLTLDVGSASIVGPEGPQGPAGPQGPQGPAGVGSDYGSDRVYASSEGESSTTSGSYQNKVRLDATISAAKKYKLEWFYEVNTTDLDMNIRVQSNNNDTHSEHEHVSADEGDKHYWASHSGFIELDLPVGAYFAEIDYNDDGGGSAKIRRARLELKAVE